MKVASLMVIQTLNSITMARNKIRKALITFERYLSYEQFLVEQPCYDCKENFMVPNGCFSPQARLYVLFYCWDCIKKGRAQYRGFKESWKYI